LYSTDSGSPDTRTLGLLPNISDKRLDSHKSTQFTLTSKKHVYLHTQSTRHH